MAVPNRVIAIAAVVIVAVFGAEAYVREQDVQELRQTIAVLSTKIDSTDAAVKQASMAAAQAAARADQLGAIATQAKETADRTAAVAAQLAGQTAASPAPARQMVSPTSATDISAGRNRAMLICAVCHVVAPDQQVAPVLQPPAPDFHSIVNRPAATENSLRDFLLTPHGKMPNPMLMDQQVKELVAYMISLRDHR